MAVTMSKPPKKTTITRPKDAVRGVRWRSAEERATARRRIEAIRRAAELERQERFGRDGGLLDPKVLRSPKVIGGILVVLVLLGLALTTATYRPRQDTVETVPLVTRGVRKSLNSLAVATTLFRVHTGDWPSQSYGLFELCHDYGHHGYRGPYIDWAYKDPWGTHFVYIRPKSKYEAPTIYSCGPDGKPNTPDDICLSEEDFLKTDRSWKTPEPAPSEEKPVEVNIGSAM